RDRLAREANRVRPHVGDEADRSFAEIDALVEPLCRAHGALRTEAELARGFLLERRGSERRRRVALALLLFDARDGERPGRRLLERAADVLGARAVRDGELLDLLAAELGEPGGEGLRGLLGLGVHGPVLARHEGRDLRLALADQPQRGALDAARGRAR